MNKLAVPNTVPIVTDPIVTVYIVTVPNNDRWAGLTNLCCGQWTHESMHTFEEKRRFSKKISLPTFL